MSDDPSRGDDPTADDSLSARIAELEAAQRKQQKQIHAISSWIKERETQGDESGSGEPIEDRLRELEERVEKIRQALLTHD